MTTKVQTITIGPEAADMRLDRWLQKRFAGLSHIQVEKLCRKGQIRIDGSRVKANARLEIGQSVRIPPINTDDAPPPRTGNAPLKLTERKIQEVQAMVLHRDDAVIVLNKPPGLAVQGGTNQGQHLDGLLDALCFDGERPKLVHRLDKDTSGVLVLARSDVAARRLTEAFRHHDTRKEYWAVTAGVPEVHEGEIRAPLSKQGGIGHERVGVDEKDGKQATTLYAVVEAAHKQAAWVTLWPLTGRTHQLRVHMTLTGAPILGDGKYGGPEARLDIDGVDSRKMHLHAHRIIMPHPQGGTLDVTAPLPAHMAKTWHYFGFGSAPDGDPFADILATRAKKRKR